MDANRFEFLTRSLSGMVSRRATLAATIGGVLALPAAAESRAGKRKKKVKPVLNAFGCVDAGRACSGNDALCCSGICEGTRPKKGKKDASRCVAHHSQGCTAARNVCSAGRLVSKCGDPGADALCMTTTGNAAFCAHIETFDPDINCRPCAKDADCEAMTGPGSACVVLDGPPYCTMMSSCTAHGSSQGTACVVAAA